MGLFGKKPAKPALAKADACEETALMLDMFRDKRAELDLEPEWTHGIYADGILIGGVDGVLAFLHDAESEHEYDIVGESNYSTWLTMLRGNLTPARPREIEITAIMLRDRANPYDTNAIAVTIGGRKVGFIPREDAAALAPLFDKLDAVDCAGVTVPALIGWGDGDRASVIGVRLDMPPGIADADLEVIAL